jgi:phosphoribosyl 1,2-cyclic phosphodiesterase
VALAERGAREIILAHLSRENNTPAMARNAVELALSAAGFSEVRLTVAPRDHMSEAYCVRRTLCKE